MKFSAYLLLSLVNPFAMGQVAPVARVVGPLGTARAGHTATLLQGGRVLIAGGGNYAGSAFSSTEIYDPTSQIFMPSANMTTARVGHTATLLPDGRVLIIGGDSIGSAEIYDPIAGTFTATAGLVAPRQGFNATLLNNGKVLVDGGLAGPFSASGYAPIGDAEVYDPSTGVFTRVSPYAGTLASDQVATDGFGSTSTLLPDGTVLFAAEPISQVYDPVNNAFSLRGPVPVMTEAGTVFTPSYLAGQTASPLMDGMVLVAGGEQEDTGRFTSTAVYSPRAGVFLQTGTMARARDNHTATLLPDGSVLMAGGESQNCDIDGQSISCWFSGTESSMELYEPDSGMFFPAGNMTASRELHTATLLNTGDVLLAGGLAYAGIGMYSGLTASAELFHPASPSPAPVLYPIWHATTGQLVSAQAPAVAGEVLSMYVNGLAEGGAIPPQVAVAALLAEIDFFGDAPGYSGYSQVNFRLPNNVAPGAAVPIRLSYLNRTSGAVTIAIQ